MYVYMDVHVRTCTCTSASYVRVNVLAFLLIYVNNLRVTTYYVIRGAVKVWQPKVTPLSQLRPGEVRPAGQLDGPDPYIQKTSLAADKQVKLSFSCITCMGAFLVMCSYRQSVKDALRFAKNLVQMHNDYCGLL